METKDLFALVHPAIAVTVVFPLIGIVIHFAWQTRQRRLQPSGESKSKIPPTVGRDHVQLGKRLTGAVVGVCLLGLAFPTVSQALQNQTFTKQPWEALFLVLMFAATIASLVFLYQAHSRLWRVVFTVLTSLGVLVIGFQDSLLGRQQPWIYRRDFEWQVSHFYYGIVVTVLMIISLAIVQEIYQDRSNRWRLAHICLNSIALLLFIGQGMTGTRDLLEIPLSWQEPYVYSCDFVKKTCPTPTPPPGQP
ncbi:hypothetical protein DO97_06485 [Neosynechococcus sphagnicola sy1]|uniref:DUF4079 domain-containing protein n=1 Tax=Neosynechococcus sphagnicola sy1 TaxID=1497020 RepID=A0A098TK44_9CYAN|nr:DUF4079 domain-containing protein [Neosynechococcus sphagnicola]KGF72674.1 hypothetical protein DO97_06485 [Neosynechococcus sphagnicola sy1]